jgi:predicted ATPase
VSAANQAAVVELCRRLDGLPLAIELAAVRTRVLTAQQILDRLTDRFGLLTSGGRVALRRVLPREMSAIWSGGSVSACRVARLDGPGDRQHPFRP